MVQSFAWYFEVAPSKFQPFPDEANEKLERAWAHWQQGNGQGVVKLESGLYQYHVNLDEKIQVNASTGKERKVERRQQANRYEERLRNLEAHARDVEDENQRLQQRVQQLIQEQNMQKAAEKSKEEAIISQYEESLRHMESRAEAAEAANQVLQQHTQQLDERIQAAEKDERAKRKQKKQRDLAGIGLARQAAEADARAWLHGHARPWLQLLRQEESGKDTDVSQLAASLVQRITSAAQVGNISWRLQAMLGPWQEVPRELTGQEIEFPTDSPDFRLIESVFQGSLQSHRLDSRSSEWCDPPRLDVVRICALPLPKTKVRGFIERRKMIARQDVTVVPCSMDYALRPAVGDKDCNEYFLFHGSKWDTVPKIIEGGFDWRHAGSAAGMMFGKGSYFAPAASKCDLYAQANDHNEQCILMARVLLGNPFPADRSCWHVGQDAQSTLDQQYHSICALTKSLGGAVDFPEVVIFNKSQALPLIRIVYRHRDECRCNLCRRNH